MIDNFELVYKCSESYDDQYTYTDEEEVIEVEPVNDENI